MIVLPSDIMPVLAPFMQLFSDRTWQWVQVLLIGAILAPARRTVTAVLRVMGLSDEAQFQLYHRVLNRVAWSGLTASRILLGLLVTAFVAAGAPLVVAADETLERRRGPKIHALGCFRDPVRSTKKRKVMSFGLRWVCMVLLVRVPWSSRVWALPFLTVLAPGTLPQGSKRRHHKTSVDWVGQLALALRRWYPQRALILVVDGALGALKLGLRCQCAAVPITLVSRLRWDARLYEATPLPGQRKRGRKAKYVYGPRQVSLKARVSEATTEWEEVRVAWYGGTQRRVEVATGTALWVTQGQAPLALRWVLVRDRSGEFEPQAFFSTDQTASAVQVVEWFVWRWSEEVTFEEVRAHLGVETQRQWSKLAIERTTPVLLGLFSVVVLLAKEMLGGKAHPVRRSAWYVKREATFAATLGLVREHLWRTVQFPQSHADKGQVGIPSAVLHGLLDTLSYAA